MPAITGIEVSLEQGAVDWTRAWKNASFVYLSASKGGKVVDPNLKSNWQGAGVVGLGRGLIHEFHPRNVNDWKKQLELFVGLVLKYPCELPPVLDIQNDNGLRKVEMDNIGAKFCKRFAETIGTGLILRTNARFFDQHLPLTDWAKHRQLWVVDTSGDDEPQIPVEWTKQRPPWIFWTYSSSENTLGPVFGLSSRHADLIRFYADPRRFKKLFTVTVTPVDPPQPGESVKPSPSTPIEFRVLEDALDIHAGPGRDFPQVGSLQRDERVSMRDLAAEGEIWIEIEQGKWVPWKIRAKRFMSKE